MKRLGILVLALAGLTALFASCGGGEDEVGILAVAFRLDGESPILSAYIGDPAEDPFELPAGRYYIEALDQDDVHISLGAVDVEAGDVVDFPPSFEAAGGVADREQAEPLITLASFLIVSSWRSTSSWRSSRAASLRPRSIPASSLMRLTSRAWRQCTTRSPPNRTASWQRWTRSKAGQRSRCASRTCALPGHPPKI